METFSPVVIVVMRISPPSPARDQRPQQHRRIPESQIILTKALTA